MEVIEVVSAFSDQQNNGYGLTLSLCLDSSFDFGHNKLLLNSIQLEWVDILNGEVSGIQVWTELEYFHDYGALLKSKFNDADIDNVNYIQTAILSYVYDEICYDSSAVFTLLSRYYHEHSLYQKHQLEKLEKKNSRALTNLKNLNSNNYISVHNEIGTIFLNAIQECCSSFTEITRPILPQSEILCLVDLYKAKLNLHYVVIKKCLDLIKKKASNEMNTM